MDATTSTVSFCCLGVYIWFCFSKVRIFIACREHSLLQFIKPIDKEHTSILETSVMIHWLNLRGDFVMTALNQISIIQATYTHFVLSTQNLLSVELSSLTNYYVIRNSLV